MWVLSQTTQGFFSGANNMKLFGIKAYLEYKRHFLLSPPSAADTFSHFTFSLPSHHISFTRISPGLGDIYGCSQRLFSIKLFIDYFFSSINQLVVWTINVRKRWNMSITVSSKAQNKTILKDYSVYCKTRKYSHL